MKVFRIIEDIGAEPEIKELGNPGIVKEDEQDEAERTTEKKQEKNTGD